MRVACGSGVRGFVVLGLSNDIDSTVASRFKQVVGSQVFPGSGTLRSSPASRTQLKKYYMGHCGT